MLDLTGNPSLMNWIFPFADEITIEICYKSVFDDYWLIRREGVQTNMEVTQRTSVAACDIPDEEQFME